MSNTQAQTTTDVAFGFVQALAAELSSGRLDLPSFPEIAIRVRRVLADDNSTLEKVVRVVGSEPALAARLLRMANSASLNTTGRQIADLRTAINRMGYNMVRSASMSFAMAQIRNNSKLASIKPQLDELWERSTLVAAIAYVIARRCTKLNPDAAMLAGTMHGIGKLYVLTRVAAHPELFVSADAVKRIIDEWHVQIGRAILESWEFAEETVAAIGDQDDPDRDGPEVADLGDVIATANMAAPYASRPDQLPASAATLAAPTRLGLDQESLRRVLDESAVEMAALRSALGA
ncbi:MAG: HDOD domain-containing protein [Gammaproteobacteria bacterium]|nr:HDOD domain-containing protein [Gammaproteobacteria bacterium]